ncbi:MAG: hypothetical protein ACPGVZ_14600 [Myxococcota bacterium]
MNAPQAGAVAARLGNVEAAIFEGRLADEDGLDLLEAHFVTARRASSGNSVRGWIDVLAGAKEERVLIVGPSSEPPDLEVIQALLCWPESEVLVFRDAPLPTVALGRPRSILASARSFVETGSDEATAWLASIEAERVDRAALGLGASAEAR